MLIIFLPKIIFNPSWCHNSAQSVSPQWKLEGRKDYWLQKEVGDATMDTEKCLQWWLSGKHEDFVRSDLWGGATFTMALPGVQSQEWERVQHFSSSCAANPPWGGPGTARRLCLEGNLSISASEGKVSQYMVVCGCRGCPPVTVSPRGIRGWDHKELVPVPCKHWGRIEKEFWWWDTGTRKGLCSSGV